MGSWGIDGKKRVQCGVWVQDLRSSSGSEVQGRIMRGMGCLGGEEVGRFEWQCGGLLYSGWG